MVNHLKIFLWLAEWIFRLSILNFLWVLFTLCGLVIFGFAPSTIASFYIVKSWLKKDGEINVFATFRKKYSESFLKANIIGIMIFLTSVVLFIDYQFSLILKGWIAWVFLFLLIQITILIIAIFIYMFPLISFYNLTILSTLKLSVKTILLNPLKTLSLIIIMGSMTLLMLLLPGTIPFFLISANILLVTHISLRIFPIKAETIS